MVSVTGPGRARASARGAASGSAELARSKGKIHLERRAPAPTSLGKRRRCPPALLDDAVRNGGKAQGPVPLAAPSFVVKKGSKKE